LNYKKEIKYNKNNKYFKIFFKKLEEKVVPAKYVVNRLKKRKLYMLYFQLYIMKNKLVKIKKSKSLI
jgi:hypothetical protein